MTEMLTRPLTTENRVLRAVSGADLSVSLGTTLDAVFNIPTMGGLVSDAFKRGMASPDLPEPMQEQFLADEMLRDQERLQLQSDLANPAISDAERQAIYDRFTELGSEANVQLNGFEREQVAAGRLQDPVALAEKYGDLGLQFDRPMSEEEARVIADGKRVEIIRDALIDKGPKGFLPGVAKFGAALAGMASDPLEIATMFIPVVGQAGKAAAIGRFGRVGGRVLVGAAEGGIGQAMTEPFYYGLSRAAQLDYEMSDSLMNIGLGFAFGGGIGAVGGVFARASRAPDAPLPSRLGLDPSFSREVADTALRQFVNGVPVDIGRLLDGRDLRSSTTLSRSGSGVEFQATQTLAREQAREIAPSFVMAGSDGRAMDFGTADKAKAAAAKVGGTVVLDGSRFTVRVPVDGDVVRRPNGKPVTFQSERAAQKFIDQSAVIPDTARVFQLRPGVFAVARDIPVEQLDAMLALPESIRIPDGVDTRQVAVLPDADALLSKAVRGVVARQNGVAEAVASARATGPLEDIEASRAADVRLSDDFLNLDLETREMMVRQIEASPEVQDELLAIRDIEDRANTFAEVAEAAAVCLARGLS